MFAKGRRVVGVLSNNLPNRSTGGASVFNIKYAAEPLVPVQSCIIANALRSSRNTWKDMCEHVRAFEVLPITHFEVRSGSRSRTPLEDAGMGTGGTSWVWIWNDASRAEQS